MKVKIIVAIIILAILSFGAYGIYGKCYANNRSLLHVAVDNNWNNIIVILLSIGADVNSEEGQLLTPLSIAVENHDLITIKLLIKHGANIHVRDIDGDNLITLSLPGMHSSSIERAKSLTVTKYLIAEGVSLDDINTSHAPTLLFAIMDNDIKALQLLLDSGAKIHPPIIYSRDYILDAAWWTNDIEIVRLLLKYGARYNVCDNSKDSPVQVAQFRKHFAVAAFLQSIKADKLRNH